MPVAAPPPTQPQPDRLSGRPRRRRGISAPLRPTAVAGLALLLALASLRQPVDGVADGAIAPAGADGPTMAAPPLPELAEPSASPMGESPVADRVLPALIPAAAVDGIDSAAWAADGARPAGEQPDAHEVAVRLALRLGASMAGQLPGVIVTDPFGAAWMIPRHLTPGHDTTLSLELQER